MPETEAGARGHGYAPSSPTNSGRKASGGLAILYEVNLASNIRRTQLKKKTWTVYWIRSAAESDIASEGYVGACENFPNRMSHHLKHSSNYNIRTHLLRDANSLFVEIVGEFNKRDHAFNLEKHLRPIVGIGWNISPGNYQYGRDRTVPALPEIREILPLNMQWTIPQIPPIYRRVKVKMSAGN